jgi:hypothetical protein
MSTNENFNNLQKARLDLIGEIQAIYDYDNHIVTTTDPIARQTWQDIKEEELVHVGELMGLINYLDSSQRQFVENGLKEFNERLNNQNRTRD